jgi:hypothetical protein
MYRLRPGVASQVMRGQHSTSSLSCYLHLSCHLPALSLNKPCYICKQTTYLPFRAFRVVLFALALFFRVLLLLTSLEETVETALLSCIQELLQLLGSLSNPLLTKYDCQRWLQPWSESGNHLNPFSVTKNWTSPSTSGFFHSS